MLSSNLPQAGAEGAVTLKEVDFHGSSGCWFGPCGTGAGTPRPGGAAVRAGATEVIVGLEDCAIAAEGGHLEMLQWARAHGCEWGAETWQYAVQGGNLD